MKKSSFYLAVATVLACVLWAGGFLPARADFTEEALDLGLRLGFPKLVRDSGAPISPRDQQWDEYFAKMRDISIVAYHKYGALPTSYNTPSGAMQPTLEVGDFFYAAPHYYADHDPMRGDVVLFDRDGVHWIKRVIGLPGDRIEMKAGRLWINGEIVERHPAESEGEVRGGDSATTEYIETLPGNIQHHILELGDEGDDFLDDSGPFLVPEGQYFVLGDNRDRSRDSREADFGYVARAAFTDKPDVIYMSRLLAKIGAQLQPQ